MRRVHYARRAGYTLIEVMMAVAIMTVGSLGVLALHEATTVGNMTSHDIETATASTRIWIERLEREALLWTAPGTAGLATTTNLALAPLAAPTPGDWFTPTPVLAGEAAAFDHGGLDEATAADQRFCTNVRLTWAVPNEALRVDVRTYFTRHIPEADRVTFDCAADPADITAELDAAAPRISAVYGSTVIRWTRTN